MIRAGRPEPTPARYTAVVPAAVFDMDGTLVDSEELVVLSAQRGLRDYFEWAGASPEIPARERILSLVGLPSLEYFAGLVPPARRGDAARVRDFVGRREVEILELGEGRLFPGTADVLRGLRRSGWRLALVSNCGRVYFDANLRFLGLRSLVDVAFCLDDAPSKTENVREALAVLGRSGGVMVGDRRGDLDAGRANGLRVVGCSYGYGADGELEGADARIDGIHELPEAMARVTASRR